MPASSDDRPPRPTTSGRRWTSFVAPDAPPEKVVRGLHEEANPQHRIRVEHDPSTLLIHLSDEEGPGWTTLVVDRATRQWAVAQARRQSDSGEQAYDALYGPAEAVNDD